MATFSRNLFSVLGEEETETDKLGNTKPKEKKVDETTPRSKREAARKLHTRVAVSPPSRRGRDRGAEGGGGGRGGFGERQQQESSDSREPPPEDKLPPRRGRQFDRHSGTGRFDNEKKVNQGWGHPGRAEQLGAQDGFAPEDPGAGGDAEQPDSGAATPAGVEYKTLDEYLASQPNLADKFKLTKREPNEGVDESQWKNAVPLQREKDEDVYFSGKETGAKQRTKSKREKVYLEIDQPLRRTGGGGAGRGGGRRGGRGGRGGSNTRGGRGRGGSAINVDVSDANAFPTLGAS